MFVWWGVTKSERSLVETGSSLIESPGSGADSLALKPCWFKEGYLIAVHRISNRKGNKERNEGYCEEEEVKRRGVVKKKKKELMCQSVRNGGGGGRWID
jgi:hypothetical protein